MRKKNQEFAKQLQNLLYNKQIDTLLTCLEAQINLTEDVSALEGLKELQLYCTENKDASGWLHGFLKNFASID